jgi:hypothetical protein
MTPDATIHQHRMTLYNLDLVIDWRYENDQVKIIEVHIIHYDYPDLVKFLSGKVFKLMVEDIENNKLKSKWIDE